MTLIEMITVFFALVGTVLGGILGGMNFGLWGALVGIPVGLVGGWILGGGLGGGLVGLVWFTLICLERSQQRRVLRGHFGRYWSKARAAQWEEATGTLSVGETVQGEVVHSFYYGVCIDTGHRFPALLTKLHTEGPWADENPSNGTTIVAKFLSLETRDRVIELTQAEFDSPHALHVLS